MFDDERTAAQSDSVHDETSHMGDIVNLGGGRIEVPNVRWI